MTNENFFNVLYERTSTRAFNPEKEISSTELHEILKGAAQAPSAWNLQHWKFLVFQGEDVQKRLHPIAYNQQQILDASAVVAILGDLEAYKNVEPVYGPIVEQGFMKEEAKERLAKNIESAYAREQFPRDAAFSNASLAAMQLMLAAKATGWDTCDWWFQPTSTYRRIQCFISLRTNYAYYNWGINFKRPSCTTNERRTSE